MVLSAFAGAYARRAGGGAPGFVADIHTSDEMLSFARHLLRGSDDAAAVLYFSTGRLIADSLSAALAWRFRGERPASVLDFAAGFGRVTRFLSRRLAPSAITVAEINEEPLAFQERAFGVAVLRSTAEAAGFAPPRAFSAVLASSFFSHVAERRFEEWLGRLWRCVQPGGVLIFSTHGPSLRPEPSDWSRGIVFEPSSETMRLDPLAYGTSWVTPDFVARTAAAVCEPGQLSSFAFGLDGRQDLYVVARPPDVPADALSIAPVPRGDLDRLDFSWGGTLVCEGHLDSPGEAEVVFLVRDEERGRMSIGEGEQPRTWTFEVPIPDVSPDDVLRIEARTPAGRERILAMGTLMPFL